MNAEHSLIRLYSKSVLNKLPSFQWIAFFSALTDEFNSSRRLLRVYGDSFTISANFVLTNFLQIVGSKAETKIYKSSVIEIASRSSSRFLSSLFLFGSKA